MFTTFIILAAVASILLIFAVLIQNPKGGGIAANFSAANQIAGVKKTNEFIEKATWTLAIALFVFAIGSRFVYSTNTEKTNEFLEQIDEANIDVAPASIQNIPQDPSNQQVIKADPSEAPEEGGLGN
ncbi:MAG: preprotein translocase subunit SecG [Bacteroidetes bacterium]|nr:MAG: preprotein translocase subunit SecG [Bacteroidota bacterium]